LSRTGLDVLPKDAVKSFSPEVKEAFREKKPHDVLKLIAAVHLGDMGFPSESIQTEYPISSHFFGKIVDVVGLSENRRVAVECGRVAKIDLLKLHFFFDEVYHCPYPWQKRVVSTNEELKQVADLCLAWLYIQLEAIYKDIERIKWRMKAWKPLK